MVVQGRELCLSVQREDADVWRWKITYADGQVLEKGFMTTRLAAQVSVQRAFEGRLLACWSQQQEIHWLSLD